MRRKILAIILVITLIMGNNVGVLAAETENVETMSLESIWSGEIATAFAGGDGTETSPYQISSGEELAYLAQQVNAGNSFSNTYFELTEDIILNDVTNYENWEISTPENNWIPIGTLGDDFSGVFYGNGHIISGMYINSSERFLGLFGYTNENAIISNLVLGNIYIENLHCGYTTFIGGIVGSCSGDIINSSLQGDIKVVVGNSGEEPDENAGICFGGIAGLVQGNLKNVSNNCEKNYFEKNDRCYWGFYGGAGAIAGRLLRGNITDSENNSSMFLKIKEVPLTRGDYIGGIVGQQNYGKIVGCTNRGDFDVQINGTSSTGDLNESSLEIGGIVGFSDSLILNCYNSGNCSFDTSLDEEIAFSLGTGGIVGFSDTVYSTDESNNTSCIICNSYSIGDYNYENIDDTVDLYMGGLIASTYTENVLNNCYWKQSEYLSIGNESVEKYSEFIIEDVDDLNENLNKWSLLEWNNYISEEVINRYWKIEENSEYNYPVLTNERPENWMDYITIYTVDFKANGGENLSVSSIEVEENQAIGTLPTVERDGYTFNGWYTAKSGGSLVTEETIITSDMTLYAKWKEDNGSIIVTAIEDLQSSHNYWNDQDTTWVYTVEGAENLKVVFSDECEVEDDCDNLIIYDYKDDIMGEYTGTELAGRTLRIEGDTIKIRLISDVSITCYGFKVESVTVNEENNDGLEDDEQTENIYELIIEDGVVIRCTGTPVDVVIPEGVTKIGNRVFYGRESLKSIVIPDGVTNIGGETFRNCSNLSTIKIPSSIIGIGDYAFTGTKWLKNQEQEKALVIVNNILLSGKNASGDIVIPNGITRLVGGAFINNGCIDSVLIPESVTSIGAHTFWSSSIEKLVVLSNIVTFGYQVFDFADEVVIYGYPNSTVETYANENDIPFVYIDEVRETVYAISFNGNGGYDLSSVYKEVEANQKLGTLPTVQRAGYTFKGWYTAPTGGTRVTADTVVTADMTLYAQWDKIIVTLNASNVTLNTSSFTYDGAEKKPTVTVKVGNKTLTLGTDYLVSYKNNVGVGTATVIVTGKGDYTGSVSKSFTITAKSIESALVTLSATSCAYDGKEKTPTVTLRFGNTSLKQDTDYKVIYANNKNIGTATVTITGIGNYTGKITKNFTITLVKGKTFTSGAYKYKVTGSNTVAFAGVKSKTTKKVTIAKTVKYGGKTFKITSIADKALKGKNKVTKVTIGANVTTIGKSAFEGCTKLSSVTIGSKVTKIGDKAFKKCTALTKITVPSKVTTIGKEVFNGCKKLKTITIKSTKLKSVGKNTFKGIQSKAKIKVPKNKLDKYKNLLKKKGQGSKVKITK